MNREAKSSPSCVSAAPAVMTPTLSPTRGTAVNRKSLSTSEKNEAVVSKQGEDLSHRKSSVVAGSRSLCGKFVSELHKIAPLREKP